MRCWVKSLDMDFICWLDTGVADIDGFCLQVEAADGLITRVDFRDASSIDFFRGSGQVAPHELSATEPPTTTVHLATTPAAATTGFTTAKPGLLSATDLSLASTSSLPAQHEAAGSVPAAVPKDSPAVAIPPAGSSDAAQSPGQAALQMQFESALARWRDGDPEAFRNLPLADAKTEFAAEVRQVLLATRPGELLTYQELARRSGRPKAIRAAASACARNPLPLLVPCHRVIPTRAESPGKIRDYGNYAYGRAIKAALIEYEAVTRPALT